MSDQFSSKTLPATPRKQQAARRQGNVPKSQSLIAGTILLTVALLLSTVSSSAVQQLTSNWTTLLHYHPQLDSIDQISHHITQAAWSTLYTVTPLACAIMSIAVLASVLQTGILLRPSNIQPTITRLSPVHWWKYLTNTDHWMQQIASLGRAVIIIGVLLGSLWSQHELLAQLSFGEMSAIGQNSFQLITELILQIAMAFFVLAMVDYGWQRWKWIKSLRMTSAELAEETNRQNQPHYRSSHAVMSSDLSSLNRTLAHAHCLLYATTGPVVALKYDPELMDVPEILSVVTEKKTASQLRTLGQQQNIRMFRQDQLALQLASIGKSNQKLPPQFYEIVARLLQNPS